MERTTRGLIRGLGLAVWSWIVFALLGAVTMTAMTPDLPPNAPDIGLPESVGEAFLDLLVFDFGPSTSQAEPALDVVLGALGPTVTILVEAIAIAAALSAGLIWLARRSEISRQTTELAGYVLGLPAPAWLLALLWIGQEMGVGLFRPPATDAVSYLAPALVLSLPIAGAVGRYTSNSTPDRDWVLEGWLWVSWTLSTLIVVEQGFQTGGVGSLVVEFLTAGDIGIVAAAGVVTIVALLASLGREIAWVTPVLPSHLAPLTEPSVEPDGGTPTVSPRDVLRTNRRVQLGLGLFGSLLVVGFLGRVVLDPSLSPSTRVGVEGIVAGLKILATRAVWIGLIASVAGVALGLLTARVAHGGVLAALLAGYAMNIPLFVWVWLPTAGSLDRFPTLIATSVAVAPLVGMAAARDIDRVDRISFGVLLPALGLAMIGAAVAILVTTHVDIFLSGGWLSIGGPGAYEAAFVRTAVAVGGPVMAFFLLGSGLRTHVARE